MALNKRVLPTDPHAWWVGKAALGFALSALLAPIVLQWLVLRRAVPRLPAVRWVLVIVGSACLLGAIGISFEALRDWIRDCDLAFQRAGLRSVWTQNGLIGLLGLPWWQFVTSKFVQAAVITLLPTIMIAYFARAGRVGWLVLWLGFTLGIGAAEVVDKVYDITQVSPFPLNQNMNGYPWGRRVSELFVRACAGAVGGVVSGITLVAALRSESSDGNRAILTWPKGMLVGGAIAIGFAMAAPIYIYLSGPKGLRAGLPEIRKALSPVPSADRATGAQILTFSHSAEVETDRFVLPQYVKVSFAPDGTSFVTFAADGRLTQIDVATGRVLRMFGSPPERYERVRYLWTPDGRYFLILDAGRSRTIGTGKATRTLRQSRIKSAEYKAFFYLSYPVFLGAA
ncbi:MAG: hypothetical protein MJE12_11220, partial [Alphaproteobacteria bacterium]|nr:hypothetical protein [Alphaproteobacteria bacterium]